MAARPIVFVQRALRGGGAERVVRDLVNHLDRERYRPIVATLFQSRPDPLYANDVETFNVRSILPALLNQPEPEMAAEDIDPVAVSMAPPTVATEMTPQEQFHHRHGAFLNSVDNHWVAGYCLADFLASFDRPPLVVSVMEEATVAAWMAQMHVSFPQIAWLHCPESIYLPAMHRDHAKLAAERFALSGACRSARLVVFPSDGCCDDLTAYCNLPRDHMVTIANPVDCARIRALARSESPIKRDGGPLFAALGRLDAQKGIDLLFHAFAAYPDPSARLVLIGKGTDEPMLRDMATAMNLGSRVVFAGFHENPYPILREADALVLSSRFESFALVLVEAMICGVPIVAFDCPFGPSDVLDAGRCGILVPPNDPCALAAGMRRVIGDEALRHSLIGRGYKRALDYDAVHIANTWRAMIDERFAQVV